MKFCGGLLSEHHLSEETRAIPENSTSFLPTASRMDVLIRLTSAFSLNTGPKTLCLRKLKCGS